MKALALKYDQTGYPIILIKGQNYDKTKNLAELQKFILYSFHQLITRAEQNGKDQITVIYDNQGF